MIMSVKFLKLGRNDICHCGSGKKYKSCCITKDEKLYSIGISTYDGREVVFDKNKDDKTFQRLVEWERGILLHDTNSDFSTDNINIILEEDGINHLLDLYEFFDEGIENIKKYASCRKGCNACCNVYVDTTPLEGKVIVDFINRNFSEEARRNLAEKTINNAKNTIKQEYTLVNPSLKDNHIYNKMPCAFLDDNGLCSIYDVRPLACRKLTVTSNPKLCFEDESMEVNFLTSQFVEQAILTLNKLNLNIYGDFYLKNNILNIKHLTQWFNEDLTGIN
jgi:uncharacterized protein